MTRIATIIRMVAIGRRIKVREGLTVRHQPDRS
jgi:hypothetical protein